MSNISLTFVAHQPNRLIHYDFFKIGEHAFYEDDDLNARVLSTVAERCYFPANRLMKQLIEMTEGKFRFGLRSAASFWNRPCTTGRTSSPPSRNWQKPDAWTS